MVDLSIAMLVYQRVIKDGDDFRCPCSSMIFPSEARAMPGVDSIGEVVSTSMARVGTVHHGSLGW